MNDLRRAAKSVRDLVKEQGSITAREAHDAWRWPLTALNWKQGELDEAEKTHPLMCSFDSLEPDNQNHALALLGEDDAEQDDDFGQLPDRIEVTG